MLSLHEELIIKIIESLTDKEKILLTMTSEKMNTLKYKIRYCEKINIYKIRALPFFDNFEYVTLGNDIDNKCRYPKYVKYIHYIAKNKSIPDRVTHLIIDRLSECLIPSTVTHLTFKWCEWNPTKIIIPQSVTYLKFRFGINPPIKNCIPLSVTHIAFEYMFDQCISDIIPSSITHLTFGWQFNKPIKNSIPSNVTHLAFNGYHFNQPIQDYIPSSVTHLTLGQSFQHPIDNIPNSVEQITLYDEYHQILPTYVKIFRISSNIQKPIEILGRYR